MNARLLEGGRFGALVSSRSPEETARAIQDALDSPAASLTMARLGRAAVLEGYSVNRLLKDMADLYRELLARPAR